MTVYHVIWAELSEDTLTVSFVEKKGKTRTVCIRARLQGNTKAEVAEWVEDLLFRLPADAPAARIVDIASFVEKRPGVKSFAFFYRERSLIYLTPYSYTEAILENGVLVVENMKVLKPFVLNDHGTSPGHAGVIINGDHWELRGSTDSKYADGKPVLTVYASGSFRREDPDYDPKNFPTFDIRSLMVLRSSA